MAESPQPNRPKQPSEKNRRTFLQGSAAAVAGGALTASLGAARFAHGAGSDVIKVGVIGCGGRGRSAAQNACRAGKDVRITALCDLFDDRLQQAHNILSRRINKAQYDVADDHRFSGFDGYKQMLQTDVDVVCLCTPPHFRPAQLKAAIDAGKHVFCEKPVAVDAPGVRSVMETSKRAKEKDLTIVSGLCWRYDYGVRETVGRIKDGAIGDITSIQENYLTGTLWHRGGRDEFGSEMEYQCRNWLYFTWLSGDHIVEQHIHSLDKAMWLMDDVPPVHCFGLGGRQHRTAEQWGHIYDHFAVCYEWADGRKTFAFTRQMSGCHNDTDDYIVGTKGRAAVLDYKIESEGKTWEYKGPTPSMYDVEHKELFAGLRKGKHINNGDYMCKSTMMAILGREACYTGKLIHWKDALASDVRLGPDKYEFGDIPVPEVARPGSA